MLHLLVKEREKKSKARRFKFMICLLLLGTIPLTFMRTARIITAVVETISDYGKQDVSAQKKDPTFGVTVVHCKENKMEWLHDIPEEWNLTVYETCGMNISNASRSFKNAGSEECSAYLNTIIEQYDNLPDVSIFLQSDVLFRNIRHKENLLTEHSPFFNFEELVNETRTWANEDREFLAFGPKMSHPIYDINSSLYYMQWYPKEIFDVMELNYTDINANYTQKNEDKMITPRSGACFAVKRNRIRANSIEKYITLKKSILAKDSGEARKQCCSLENTWHALLGEPYKLPDSSSVDHIWRTIVMKKRL